MTWEWRDPRGHIDEISRMLALVANITQERIVTDFNGIIMVFEPGDDPTDVAARAMRDLDAELGREYGRRQAKATLPPKKKPSKKKKAKRV